MNITKLIFSIATTSFLVLVCGNELSQLQQRTVAEVKLSAAVTTKLDYTPLQTALTSGNWKEANRLTSNLVLELAGQKQRGYLVASDTRKLPCQELQTVNELWVKNSKGQFGFTVQAQIWQNLKGKNYDDSVRFEQQVGWQGREPIFDIKTAPKGHLPLRPALSQGIMNAWGGGWIQEITKRADACKLGSRN